MNRTPKPCKGIGKAKAFQGCGQPVIHRRYGLGTGAECGCFGEWCLSTPEGKEYLNRHIIPKAKRKALREDKKRVKQEKEKIKSLSKHKNELQTLINKIVRFIDLNQGYGCISCGAVQNGQRVFDAGHFYTVGAYPSLRFHMDNIHAQCRHCNSFKHGAYKDYIAGLTERYGYEYYNYVAGLKEQYQLLKLSVPEVMELKVKCRQIIKDIDKGLDFTREQVNQILNIYR